MLTYHKLMPKESCNNIDTMALNNSKERINWFQFFIYEYWNSRKRIYCLHYSQFSGLYKYIV